jgi:nucleotide-binding universal stress UspA family protein
MPGEERLMKKMTKILFPVDPEKVPKEIVPWVLDVAKNYGAEIHLLFVLRPFDELRRAFLPSNSLRMFEEGLIKDGQENMEDFARTYCHKYPFYRTSVAIGDEVEEIIKYIKSEGMDMVIVETHSRKGIDPIFKCSIAKEVVERSPVPVLSINTDKIQDKGVFIVPDKDRQLSQHL